MMSSRLPPLVRYPIIVYPTLLSLRDVAEDSIILITLASVGLLTMACGGALFGSKQRLQLHPAVPAWFAVQAIGVVAAVVAWLFGAIAVTSIIGNLVNIWAVVLVALVLAQYRVHVNETTGIVLDALAVLVLMATALYWLGFTPSVQRWEYRATASMLRSLGIYVDRAEFPLTKGEVSHATVCGLLLVGTLLRQGNPISKIVIVAVTLYGILVADGRAALLFSLLVLLYAWLGRFRGLRFTPWVCLLGAPLFLIVARIFPSEWLALLSRSGDSAELLSGSNRLQIWSTGLSYMTEHWVHALVGAGSFGQAAMGIFDYRFLLAFSRNFQGSADSLSMHNVAMQVWFDSGIIGIFLLTLMLFTSSKYIERNINIDGYNVSAGLITFIIMNSVFSTYGLTVYWDEGYFSTMLIAFAPFASYKSLRRTVLHGRRFSPRDSSGSITSGSA